MIYLPVSPSWLVVYHAAAVENSRARTASCGSLHATLCAQVCIFMDDSLLRGNRTVKVNSGGLDAFSSPNFPPLAMLETGIRFRPSAVLDQPKGRFTIHSKLETNIAVWRSEWGR